MSAQKKNDILDEQKKARQEFLELKKMQHGEMEAPPKPSEMAVLPKTPKEKASNFWFQYKWHTISITALVIVMAILITQCATRTKYDMEVVYFTYSPILDDQTNVVADYIEQYAKDVNDDGKIIIQVINCSYSKSSGNTQYEYTMMSKMQALIAGDTNALLFITDEDSYKYFEKLSSDGGIFEGEPYKFDEDFYSKTKSEEYGALPEGLQISCRRVSNTVLANKKGVQESYDAATAVLEKLKNK